MGYELTILVARVINRSRPPCLSPLIKFHLTIEPQASNVQYFGRMSTDKLHLLARQGQKEFELFMELHRRASTQWRQHGEVFEWDAELGGALEQLVKDEDYYLARSDFVQEYDTHWNIGIKENGSCILGPPVIIDEKPFPKATF